MMEPSRPGNDSCGRARCSKRTSVIAAGTGLGEAVLFWDGTKQFRWRPRPATPILLRIPISTRTCGNLSRAANEFVSAEMVLSGRRISDDCTNF